MKEQIKQMIEGKDEYKALWDVGQAKDAGLLEDITWPEIAEIFNKQYREDETCYYDSSAYRKKYRNYIDAYEQFGEEYNKNDLFENEVCKTAHRAFTTAYALGANDETVNYDDSQSRGDRTFIALVVGAGSDEKGNYAIVEMRNRFVKGDELEVLSPNDTFNQTILVDKLFDLDDKEVVDAKLVQQKLKLYTNLKLCEGDILRK